MAKVEHENLKDLQANRQAKFFLQRQMLSKAQRQANRNKLNGLKAI